MKSLVSLCIIFLFSSLFAGGQRPLESSLNSLNQVLGSLSGQLLVQVEPKNQFLIGANVSFKGEPTMNKFLESLLLRQGLDFNKEGKDSLKAMSRGSPLFFPFLRIDFFPKVTDKVEELIEKLKNIKNLMPTSLKIQSINISLKNYISFSAQLFKGDTEFSAVDQDAIKKALENIFENIAFNVYFLSYVSAGFATIKSKPGEELSDREKIKNLQNEVPKIKVGIDDFWIKIFGLLPTGEYAHMVTKKLF